jgi:hypothetical protein
VQYDDIPIFQSHKNHFKFHSDILWLEEKKDERKSKARENEEAGESCESPVGVPNLIPIQDFPFLFLFF